MQNPFQIEQILEKYFSEYESYQRYTLLAIIFIVAGYQIWQAIYVSKKIEKFKNDLKRSEIKFSRFQNMQIDALKSIYDKTVSFHYTNHRFLNPVNATHESLKSKIKEWENDASTLIDTFHRERILTPQNIVDEVKLLETVLKKISERLHKEYRSLESMEDYYQTKNVQIIYGNPEDEVASIKARLVDLSTNEDIQKSDTSIQKFRKSLEEYFERLVQ
ncbi:hypothetical protein [Flavobacterium sp. HNIBRBA15423]|uniref:hypothetical protein n=1 Tax=Flavobacterium sp. HNIBRBA15423 TaxID=3458683 RepID=UPI00404466CE